MSTMVTERVKSSLNQAWTMVWMVSGDKMMMVSPSIGSCCGVCDDLALGMCITLECVACGGDIGCLGGWF